MPHGVETIRRIAARHHIDGEPRLMASNGMVNDAWEIGEFVLRITRHEECEEEAEREALIVPLVRSAGVRSPELVAISLERDLVERPYTIYRKAPGVLMSELPLTPASYLGLFVEIGREIALTATVEVPPLVRTKLRSDRPLDAEEMLENALSAGVISPIDGDDVRHWIRRLETSIDGTWSESLIHQDIHPWNVLVDPETADLTAIIDWGDAGFGDPAGEFAAMPMVGVTAALEGYSLAGGLLDSNLVTRSLLRGLSAALWEIRKLPENVFDRRWWRMPPGGWPEMRAHFEALLCLTT